MYRFFILTILLAVAVAGCSSDGTRLVRIDVSEVANAVPKFEPYSPQGNNPYRVFGKTYVPLRTAEGFEQRGIASWYGKKFHGNPTSNGEKYNMYAMTAAHKTLPLPSYVSVTNLTNNKKVIVRVNDRGPFVGTRIIDLSYAAAKKLEMVGPGTAPVLVRAVTPGGIGYGSLPSQKHYLSVGVFSDESNAKRLRKTLRNAGFDTTHIKPKQSSGRAIYQVRIGPVDVNSKLDHMISQIGLHLSEEPVLITD